MSNVAYPIAEFFISSSVSMAVAESANLSTLVTALITFGVSLITIVGGELIKLIVAYLQKKRKDITGKDEEDEKKGK